MDEKQRELDAVQAKYDQAMRDKQTLVDDAEACRRKMANATALIDGLGGEKTRWTEQSKKFDQQIQRCGSYWSELFSMGRTSLLFGCLMTVTSSHCFLGYFSCNRKVRNLGNGENGREISGNNFFK